MLYVRYDILEIIIYIYCMLDSSYYNFDMIYIYIYITYYSVCSILCIVGLHTIDIIYYVSSITCGMSVAIYYVYIICYTLYISYYIHMSYLIYQIFYIRC